jgi:hypothetical protein
MPGTLNHSPADITRHLIIAMGLGSTPAGVNNEAWSVFCDNEPDRPDNCITVYNTVGRNNGRTHVDGEVQESHGIMVRVRSQDPKTGFAKVRLIAVTLDQLIHQYIVTVDSDSYCVKSVNRTSDITALGKDSPTPTRRGVHTFNALVVVRQR